MSSFLGNAFRFPSVALRHRDILRAFVAKELRARYEGSFLGRAWPVLHPLMLFAVYGLVFTKMLDMKCGAVGGALPEGWQTTFYLLSGILPWTALVESVGRATPVVVENSNLIKKVAFPSELLPTYVVLVQLVQLTIGLCLLLGLYLSVMLAVPTGSFGDRLAGLSNLLWLPVPIVLQTLFFVGLSMLFSSLAVFVRDIGQIIPLAMMIWMFFSPVFYPESVVIRAATSNQQPWILTALHCNPMYHLLAMWRGVFAFEGGAVFPIESAGIFAAIALGVFLLGHSCFHQWKGLFADEV